MLNVAFSKAEKMVKFKDKKEKIIKDEDDKI